MHKKEKWLKASKILHLAQYRCYQRVHVYTSTSICSCCFATSTVGLTTQQQTYGGAYVLALYKLKICEHRVKSNAVEKSAIYNQLMLSENALF